MYVREAFIRIHRENWMLKILASKKKIQKYAFKEGYYQLVYMKQNVYSVKILLSIIECKITKIRKSINFQKNYPFS